MTDSQQPTPVADMDLQACDREPIHIPGAIQPHGLLFVVDPATLRILQFAGHPQRMLGREAADLLNASVDHLLGTETSTLLRSLPPGRLSEPIWVSSITMPDGQDFDVVAHERDGLLMLELEPAGTPRATAAQMLSELRAIGAELETMPDLRHLCEAAARAMGRFTGFDRVMIYAFLDDGSGAVVAEAKSDELPSFLNHRFPASDIPKQARALYVRNLVRVIPDVGYAPVPLLPPLCPATGQPLDMSDCALRSVSPIHVQYLKNMGVAASMSVSIVRDGALWGLMAFHHTSPKPVPYEQREVCKYVGQTLAQQIRAQEEADSHAEVLRLNAAREELSTSLTHAGGIEAALLEHCLALPAMVPADGAAILFGDKIVRVGYAPAEPQVRILADWLLKATPPDPYATDTLSKHHEPAAAYTAVASGLLAAVVSREDPLVLLWFRAEQIETVNWAGNPHKPVEPGETLGALTPRKSFALWQETVRGHSRPWSIAEVGAARALRQTVSDLRQQEKLRELNVQLRRTLSDKEDLLAQKDLLMREVNHRVQNSLQIVNSMLSLQAQQTSEPDVKARFDEARQQIMAVSMVHQRLWRSDQIQTVDFGTYLRELCAGLVESWGRAWEPQLRIHAAPVVLPTNEAVVLALVVTELLTNAVKYAYGGDVGPIDVTVKEQGRRAVLVTVADRGIGIRTDARQTGLGSRLTKALIAQLRGEIEVSSNAPGTRVTLTVPTSARTDTD